MTEPAERSPEALNAGDPGNDRDFDAEMEDPPEDATTHTQEPSSSTVDNEPTQPETQLTSGPPHQNRKDTTLREFLSKMDDYAPIVCTLTSLPGLIAMLPRAYTCPARAD